MKPHPFYRWKSFWLGLFVACFLAWAWWDSHKHQTYVVWSGAHYTCYLGRRDGFTLFADVPWGISLGWRFNRFAIGNLRVPDVWMGWPDVRSVLGRDSLIFFSFLGLWGGWLGWRARIERKVVLRG